jgi:hypothetical protein
MDLKLASFMVNEKHRLRVFENRAMKIFAPKWEEATGG